MAATRRRRPRRARRAPSASQPPAHEDHRQATEADDAATPRHRVRRRARPRRRPRTSSTRPCASVDEAEELRQLADEHDDRDPVEEPDPHRLRQQLGEHAETGEARDDAQRAHSTASIAGERDRLRRVAVAAEKRKDRRRDQRAERRVRPEHQDARRPERPRTRAARPRSCTDRSPAGARRARRRPCPGGRAARSEHQTGDHIVVRPSALVVPDELHAGNGAESAPAHICQHGTVALIRIVTCGPSRRSVSLSDRAGEFGERGVDAPVSARRRCRVRNGDGGCAA